METKETMEFKDNLLIGVRDYLKSQIIDELGINKEEFDKYYNEVFEIQFNRKSSVKDLERPNYFNAVKEEIKIYLIRNYFWGKVDGIINK